MSDGKLITDNKTISNQFNYFFTSIRPKLASKIKTKGDVKFTELIHYGVRGVALSWISSYLSNRTQYVYYNSIDSDRINITCGVPQGSILGPIIFLLCNTLIICVTLKKYCNLYYLLIRYILKYELC